MHFVDNTTFDGSNRLYKISAIVDLFNNACKTVFNPGQKICIDESLVPFRGRIIFRQYIPNKRHRYGIKLFKLCCDGGYTYHTKIYAGKMSCPFGSVAETVVLELIDGLLDQGRHLYVDNWYTSLSLAKPRLLKTIIKINRSLISLIRCVHTLHLCVKHQSGIYVCFST